MSEEKKKQDTRKNLITYIMNCITVFPQDLSKMIADYILIFPQFDDGAMQQETTTNTHRLMDSNSVRDINVLDWVRDHLIITPIKIEVKKLSTPWIYTLVTPHLSIGFNLHIKLKSHYSGYAGNAYLIIIDETGQVLIKHHFCSNIKLSVQINGDNAEINISKNKIIHFSCQFSQTLVSSYSVMIGCGYYGQVLKIQ